MNPLYFGSSQKPLYGVYHPPKSQPGRPVRTTGVVLCYPLGQEYMRAHRAFRQLATLLTKSGFPVLRFDYYGTGDSGGEGDAGDVEQWTSDVGTAIQELKDTAGVQKVSLVGLRLGGALVALEGLTRTDVDRIVLWDPIVDGKAYVQAMLTGQQNVHEGEGAPSHAAARVAPDATVGILGYPLTARMRGGLEQIDLRGLDAPAGDPLVILAVSSEKPEWSALRDRLTERTKKLSYRHIPSLGNWDEVDRWGSALLPQAIIQGIVASLTESN